MSACRHGWWTLPSLVKTHKLQSVALGVATGLRKCRCSHLFALYHPPSSLPNRLAVRHAVGLA
jgi:hypothetical protein